MILYLAQAYSKYEQVQGMQLYYEHPAYVLAEITQKQLWNMGFEVFSPILYSHPFHVAEFCPKIDYVAHDLKMIESWLKYDYTLSNEDFCGCDGHFQKYHGGFPCGADNWKGCKVNGYDSGVVCVFADDCFNNDCMENKFECQMRDIHGCLECINYWQSKGAKTEYDFAHAHHIKCIRLSDLLEKKKIEECEPF